MTPILVIFVPVFSKFQMKVLNKIKEAREYSGYLAGTGKQIGLVPTMGSLHQGHISLVDIARKDNDAVGVSIFVNPIQFNDPDDLRNYPRNLSGDIKTLEKNLGDDDFIFCPEAEEMYPGPVNKEYSLGRVAEVMEGSFRPGHFNGVAVVVEKLFRIIAPQRAYFGEKDFQQLAVIRKMVNLENLDIDIIGCPIIREDNGLAMSSRNRLLEDKLREDAGIIYRAISSAGKLSEIYPVNKTREIIRGRINSTPGLEVEYIEFADQDSLEPSINWENKENIRCFAAVRAGRVRLIDNTGLDN